MQEPLVRQHVRGSGPVQYREKDRDSPAIEAAMIGDHVRQAGRRLQAVAAGSRAAGAVSLTDSAGSTSAASSSSRAPARLVELLELPAKVVGFISIVGAAALVVRDEAGVVSAAAGRGTRWWVGCCRRQRCRRQILREYIWGKCNQRTTQSQDERARHPQPDQNAQIEFGKCTGDHVLEHPDRGQKLGDDRSCRKVGLR